MNEIYDAFGTALNFGDTIAVAHSQCKGRGYELRKGKITGFTKTGMVKYEWLDNPYDGERNGLCTASKVAKIGC